MDGDTAVLDGQDTAVEDVAPLEETSPETETLALTPETEDDQSPETEATDEADPLGTLDTDALKEHPKVKALLADIQAREAESYRRREENAKAEAQRVAQEQQYQQNLQLASREGQAWLYGNLSKAYKDALNNGLDEPNPQAIGQLVQQFDVAARTRAFHEVGAIDDRVLGERFKGYSLPQELLGPYRQAIQSQDPRAVHAARIAIIEDAVRKELAEKVRAEVEAELRQGGKSAAEAERLRKESTARKGQGAPTRIEGRPPGTSKPDDVLSNPEASDAARRAAFKAKHGYEP